MSQEFLPGSLGHLFPPDTRADRNLLDRMWERLDQALAECRLDVRTEDLGFGPIRMVTALGLLQVRIDDAACELWGGVIEDGTFRPIGPGLHAAQLLWRHNCPIWWLRFAFQVWVPERATFDFVACPLQRPDNIELDTSRALVRRLGMDPRFRTLPEEFDEAVGVPALMQVLAEEKSGMGMERASHVWQMRELAIASALRSCL